MPSIIIGTPCYGGQVHAVYHHSVVRLIKALDQRGVRTKLITPTSESLITRARNTIVAEFLGRSEFTHLLFLDADIGFPSSAVTRMLDLGEPLVATAYPKKAIQWSAVTAAARKGQPDEAVQSRAIGFVGNIRDGSATVVDEFVEAREAGCGMMLIRRDVFERMEEVFPDSRYVNDVGGYSNEYTRDNFWGFFDTMQDPETGRYLSEDYAFCRRWTDGCGGKIYLNIADEITHVGQYAFTGSFLAGASS